MTTPVPEVEIAIIGAGPAGLMAAEELCRAGLKVEIFDAMSTPARKLLMAGKSGLNITHSEDIETFLTRYGDVQPGLQDAVATFPPEAVRTWAQGLGSPTFVGSSGRVFPEAFKAAPLLRAWLDRLAVAGAKLHSRHRWTGWAQDGSHIFKTPDGGKYIRARATLFALGGTSWPRLGGNGNWVPAFEAAGIRVSPFQPANCGFNVDWSSFFRDRFAGEPVKNVRLSFGDQTTQGDFVITQYGVEGSAVYTLSSVLRDALSTQASATLILDLTPDRSANQLEQALTRPRGKKTLSTHLKRAAGLTGVKANLLRELLPSHIFNDMHTLVSHIKALPLPLKSPRPIEEAISVAGGVSFSEFDDGLMLKSLPGQFVAGEMLDWEAPTGGYLLTACFAQGKLAAGSILKQLARA
ncbi:TIGR03862 family flavoprotein [Kordiimonas aestuarii]|uniref:TIGR03862 family flavoprotein n=1 Tax=Kordiimonas aestuarii TaxID=1005925 RepID=UPI0021D329F1|nr:TIGR03862 family flavoprotein [Kordiimonas aestuarii]